jgi:hypothetical protein
MKKLAESGYKISSIDQKALEHYLLVSPKQWAQDALKGMINKAIKTILRDWFGKYRETVIGNISAEVSVLIPAIVQMPFFVSYNVSTSTIPIINRKVIPEQEIWESGFDVQDHEWIALNVYYQNPEEYLRYLMENKIARRREEMVKELQVKLLTNPKEKEMPAHPDDLIAQETSKLSYQNRRQREKIE